MAYSIYSRAENILRELKKCPVHLRRMEYTMLSLKAIVLDAEEKQEHDDDLCKWVDGLQNIFSQIEGTIDENKWKVYKQEGIGKQAGAPFFCSDRIVHARKMKKLCDSLDAIAAKMYEFHLTEKHIDYITMETTQSFHSASEVSTRLMKPSWQLLYPLTDAPKVYHDDRYGDFLSDFKESTHGLFHIVGDAGIGKSTLAKFFYNAEDVVKMFPSRWWVCVKEEFDTKRLLKEILRFSNSDGDCDNLTEKELCFTVQQYLRERTFLLVFQDLSIKNLDDCSMLKKLLIGNNGSKIIVTTQSEEIADALKLTKVYKTEQNLAATQSWVAVHVTGATQPLHIYNKPPSEQETYDKKHQTIYKVESLSDPNSFSLFKDYAFKDRQETPELTEITRVIVQKCKGVPLAINCVGSLLSSETRIAEWKNVNDKLCSPEVEDGNILPTLKLCYNLMPSGLKRCFLCCSQLPNDRMFTSNDVIQLWMAHGLLHSAEENYLSMESKGEKYFKELRSRCFVHEIEEYGLGYWFKLHPLVQKLGRILTEEQAKGLVGAKPVSGIRFRGSLACRPRDMVPPSASLANKCISKFICLRLLYLGNTNLREIPKAIGTLKHLRYLDLQGNKEIKRLPNSICNLHRLQTLILESCSALEQLPKDIRKLISLRYLRVTANKLHMHKNGVGMMTSLRFLAIGGCDNLENLFERPYCLKCLETLMIYDCKTLKSLPNEMIFLRSLQNLAIWSCKELSLTLKRVEFRLQRFTIRDLPKVGELPQWLQGSTETLRILEIINCPIKLNEETLKPYKAVERTIIHGAAKNKRSAGGYDGEVPNLVMRGPSAPQREMKINYY